MKLYEDGFQVIKKAITEAQAAAIRLKRGAEQDELRLQAYVPQWEESDDPLVPIETAVNGCASGYNEHWVIRPGSWVFLKSFPGGPQQQVHRDFLNSETVDADDEELPAFVLIALQNGTRLATYGWNNRRPRKETEKIVSLNKGDLVICRGDLAHRGVSYDCVNIRLHCYLDVDLPGVSYRYNMTQLCRFQMYACRTCSVATFDMKSARREHENGCT
ncbi:hypothetical protein PHYSODRAFT_308249 [Phytophthora sojae]|uniref:Fe2OG dioxygenase domain-containing protein n=1 Tax=Phytophthora sojae (strain P6497) TaxID=1094619 RepID=G4ZU65_PHYSP|nr:hypothetical protein PHYSODRAFT_302976 [Phytophthora sojae]XP_009540102.1 hypothetical protein PHYSODRAFT_308249 [Phytophthora sojae]EGZ04457.1 hypothetical protein PHYSODRAFT_308249 [Phytophthora sojae]EGZ13339.1 hypothetical protein PHYSODRAFT_302976 [Phytophthora sojae]|eukprot:XP_009530768.1 hypothetical protein PHYSODRAFT_302976 [Phytophthora sojae]